MGTWSSILRGSRYGIRFSACKAALLVALRIAIVVPPMVGAIVVSSRPAGATTCSVPYNASNGISNGQSAQASQINSNFNALQSCGNNIDNANIGTSGIYASQIKPTNGSQATFGGSQAYTFPNNVSWGNSSFGGTLNTSGSYSFSTSNGAFIGTLNTPTTGGVLTYGASAGGFTSASIATNNGTSTQGVTPSILGVFGQPGGTLLLSLDNNGNLAVPNAVFGTIGSFTGNLASGARVSGASILSSGAVQKTVSATNYGIPFNADETSGSVNNHIEHNALSVGAGVNVGAFSCLGPYTISFARAFDASPTVTLTSESVTNTTSGYLTLTLKSISTTGAVAQICNPFNSSFPAPDYIEWIALGE